MTPLVELRGVTCGYNGQPVFRDLSLRLEPGCFVGVVGPSGAGKTTLLRVLMGQIRPLTGEVWFEGHPLSQVRPLPVGYVPQLETVDWTFPVTVEQVVLMGLARDDGPGPWYGREARRRAWTVMERLGIAGLARRHIAELSGGQQQRAFLARALVRRPRLLLLDEPTSGVDIAVRHEILHLLEELHREGIAILLTTHDLNAVAAHLPRLICFNRGVIAEGAPSEVFQPEILHRLYGADLVVVRQGELQVIADRWHGQGDRRAG